MIDRITEYFRHRLWETDLARTEGWRRFGLAALRVAAHTLRSFFTDLGSLRAAGLTLVTLLALVPLLALASGIAKGLGYGEVLDQHFAEWLHKAPDAIRPAIEKIQALVHRTSFAALGVIGSAVLAYSGLLLFIRVEQALNKSWRVPRGRSWYRQLTDFLGLIVLVPLLGLAALALDSLLHGATWFHDVPWLDSFYRAGLGMVPSALLWVAFTALYKLMPAAPVRWSSAAIGGVVAGSGWLFLHGMYLSTQVAVARMNAIYATLAALPLLIIYLQVTWTVLLVGAEVSYAVQNRYRLRGPLELPPPSQAVRRRVALLMTGRVCSAFASGHQGEDFTELALALGVSEEWVTEVYEDLHAAELIGRLDEEQGRVVPLCAPDRIRVLDVVLAIDGDVPEQVRPQLRLSGGLEDRLARLDEATREILAAQLLEDAKEAREDANGNRQDAKDAKTAPRRIM